MNDSQMIFNKQELELINRLFGESKSLLMLVRKSFLQGELTDKEQEVVVNYETDEFKALLEKTFLPRLNPEADIGNLADEWINLDFSNFESAIFSCQAREIAIKYLDQELERLWTQDNPEIILKELVYSRSKDKERSYVEMRARAAILQSIEVNFGQLKHLAGDRTETQEQIEYRMRKNSNK
uniref:Uncharacterized protein n=1 Tax=viral metagenome TaxID=1070528 RepID=A0A6H1ZSV4_9ZZZZ